MKKFFSLLIIIAVIIAMWFLVRPYFQDNPIDEQLPFDPESIVDLDSLKEKAGSMSLDDLQQMVKLPAPSEIEEMTENAKESVERSIVERMAKLPPVVVDEEMHEGMEEEMKKAMEEDPEGPVIAARGTFKDADSFHKGSGDAKIFALPDGTSLLRMENFQVTNGPDLFVYLATDDTASDFVNLGRLKGNQGNQNYTIPEGTDLDKYNSVLIWCRAFSVLFSTADLG